MGNSYLYGYTEEKAATKAAKRKMSLIEYTQYLKGKQRKYRSARLQKLRGTAVV